MQDNFLKILQLQWENDKKQEWQGIWKKCYLHDSIFVELCSMMWPGMDRKP